MKSVLLLLFICGVHLVLTQTVSKVIFFDRQQNIPIAGVSVFCENDSVGLSSFDGTFEFSTSCSSYLFIHSSYEFVQVLSLSDTVFLFPQVYQLDEVEIEVSRLFDTLLVTKQVQIITKEEIQSLDAQTSADVLAATGEVFVQKSQMGGGSPMIRGFGANRILLMYDNIRVNNAIYRSGNLQNALMFDPFSLGRIEVLYGPSSTIYGSDALGGVIHFHSPNVIFNRKDKNEAGVTYRHSTVNSENALAAFNSYSNENLYSFSSLSMSSFGDLKAGGNRGSKYGAFGLRREYVKTTKGQDEVLQNDDPSKLLYSGYSQASFLQKLAFKLDKDKTLTTSFYLTTSTDIPRYDRLIQYKNDQLKYARWDYGPQQWFLTNVGYRSLRPTKFSDELQINLAYQNYQESRIDRKLNADDERTRTEKVDVVNFYLKSTKHLTSRMSIQYGVEGNYEWITSKGETKNVQSGEVFLSPSRYPDGGNWYSSLGVFGQVNHRLSYKTNAVYGFRFNMNALYSKIDSNYYQLPFEEIRLLNYAPSFQIGLNHQLTKTHVLYSNISSGFRAPNVDDVSKVFDSEPGNVVVPNENLQPEYAYNLDLGWRWTWKDSSKFELNGFYSLVRNTLVRSDHQFNGKDSILYDGEMSKIQALVNGGKSNVYGVSAKYSWYFKAHFMFYLKASMMDGREETTNQALRHVPPLYGKSGLSYFRKKWTVFTAVSYQGKIAFENLAPTEQAKSHIYPEGGALSYVLLDIGTRITLHKKVKLAVTLENLFDTFYQGYSSGIPGGGRNFKTSLTWVF
jgi:hemoglobin/transferrin/lactoferrin receptor protein